MTIPLDWRWRLCPSRLFEFPLASRQPGCGTPLCILRQSCGISPRPWNYSGVLSCQPEQKNDWNEGSRFAGFR